MQVSIKYLNIIIQFIGKFIFLFHHNFSNILETFNEISQDTRKVYLLHESKIKGSKINDIDFVTEKVDVPGHDGEEIPMILMHRSDIKLDRWNKWILHGYGAYGLNMDLDFKTAGIAAIEKGWVLAIANVRGGCENGLEWHKNGKLLNKYNSIMDFISCSEYL